VLKLRSTLDCVPDTSRPRPSNNAARTLDVPMSIASTNGALASLAAISSISRPAATSAIISSFTFAS
jgi:hypothetical protein